MKKLSVLAILFAFVACATVPVTGRKQMNLLPESQLVGMALTSYNQFLSENPALPISNAQTAQIKEVGDRISRAATKYLRSKGAGDRVSGFKWDFNLVKSNEVNAWCMPGGKVVFYTGLLPIAKNIDGIAVIMGHEVAHAIARHGNECMSQGLMVQAGGMALDVALSQKSAQTRSLFAQAYGLGATVGAVLPFSRLHESEADKLGLVFAAIAGYNIDEAAPFWQRMSKVGGGSRPPEFLSTHPDPNSRDKDIQEYLPTAKAIGRKYKL